MSSINPKRKRKDIRNPVPKDDCETVTRPCSCDSTNKELKKIASEVVKLSNDVNALCKANREDRMYRMLIIRRMAIDLRDELGTTLDLDNLSNKELLRAIKLKLDELDDDVNFLRHIREGTHPSVTNHQS